MDPNRSGEELKRDVGYRAAELVNHGMAVGLGTGSTAHFLVERLGQRVATEGLGIRAVPTSERTAAQARELGIPLTTLDETPVLDIAIDGADEVDPTGQLIKGLGGALVREKRVAVASRAFVVIVDRSKLVKQLGSKCPVPVEVAPDARETVERQLRWLGGVPGLREDDAGRPYVTDNGNHILDAVFGVIDHPAQLEGSINEIEGVVDNGIFTNLTSRVLVADPQGVQEWSPPS